MDEQLAAIYGTGQPVAYDQEDLQKTAAAELLVKLAAEQGVDLNSFSDQEIGEMITELYKNAQEEGAPPFPPKKEEAVAHEGKETKEEEEKEEEQKKEAQAKFAEADFLGRVMAHAMVQELNNIDKVASAKEVAGKVGKFFQGQARNIKEGVTGWQSAGRSGGKVGLTALERAKKLAPAAATAAGLTAAGVAAKKMSGGKKKEGSADSALEALAAERAWELAKEAGYVDEQGNLLVPQQKTASALEQAVDVRALQLLEAAGLPVEWNQ